MIRISIAERSGQPKLYTFAKDDITIGRAQGNDVILPRNNISKRHTRIFRHQGKLFVRDLDSTNGTFLNGRRIHEDEVLRAGDRIFLADFVLIVEEEEDAATPMPPELRVPTVPPVPAEELEPLLDAGPLEELEGVPDSAAEVQLGAADLHTVPPDIVALDQLGAADRHGAGATPGAQMPSVPQGLPGWQPPSPLDMALSELGVDSAEPAGAGREAQKPAGPTMPVQGPFGPAKAQIPSRPSRAAGIPAVPGPVGRMPEERAEPASPLPSGERVGLGPARAERGVAAPAAAKPTADAGLAEPKPLGVDRAAPAASLPRPRLAGEPARKFEPRRDSVPAPRPETRPKAQPAGAPRATPLAAPAAVRPAPAPAPVGDRILGAPLTKDEVRERLLTRVNDITPIRDAEPAVFGDQGLQGRIKSALLDELAILEAEDLLDPGLDRDGIVEELTGALFGLGPFPHVAADRGIESFVAYPDGTCFERRAGRWARAPFNIPPALLVLLARRLVAGLPGCTLSGAAEAFRGREHRDLPEMQVAGALGGSCLKGAAVRLDRVATLPDDLELLANAGMLSAPMAAFLRLCVEGRQTLAVVGPHHSSRTALLRALVASLSPNHRVVWVTDAAGAGPPVSQALIVRFQPPSVGESLLAESDDLGGSPEELVECLQPDLLVVERTDVARDLPLVRAMRARLGSVVLGIDADRWEPLPTGEPARPKTTTRQATPGVDPRLAACTDVVAELVPTVDGSVRMVRIAERSADTGDPFATNAIFEYISGGIGEAGEYKATKVIPRFVERRKALGSPWDVSLFRG